MEWGARQMEGTLMPWTFSSVVMFSAAFGFFAVMFGFVSYVFCGWIGGLFSRAFERLFGERATS
jgi:hypothetical protein